MNPYLAKLRGLNFEKVASSGTDKTDQTGSVVGFVGFVGLQRSPSSEFEPPHEAPDMVAIDGGAATTGGATYTRTLTALCGRCPDYVEHDRWHEAVEDGRAFLAQWGEQAERLGWTARDLFGLHQPPETPHPSYRRLSRYDCTGLVWLLQGRPAMALTETTAAIQNPTGNITIYRRFNKPALGPVGDSLDDFQ